MNWWRIKLKLGYKNYIEYHQCMNKSHAEFFIIEKYGSKLANRGVYEDTGITSTMFFTVKYTLFDGEQHKKIISAIDEDHAKSVIYTEHPKGRIAEIKIKSHGKEQLVNE